MIVFGHYDNCDVSHVHEHTHSLQSALSKISSFRAVFIFNEIVQSESMQFLHYGCLPRVLLFCYANWVSLMLSMYCLSYHFYSVSDLFYLVHSDQFFFSLCFVKVGC